MVLRTHKLRIYHFSVDLVVKVNAAGLTVDSNRFTLNYQPVLGSIPYHPRCSINCLVSSCLL